MTQQTVSGGLSSSDASTPGAAEDGQLLARARRVAGRDAGRDGAGSDGERTSKVPGRRCVFGSTSRSPAAERQVRRAVSSSRSRSRTRSRSRSSGRRSRRSSSGGGDGWSRGRSWSRSRSRSRSHSRGRRSQPRDTRGEAFLRYGVAQTRRTLDRESPDGDDEDGDGDHGLLDGSRRWRRQEPDDTLFVGGLPWQATSQDLFQVFERLVPGDHIQEARVLSGKGYGFVTLKDVATARSLLADLSDGSTPLMMHHKVLTVRQADPRWSAQVQRHDDEAGARLLDDHLATPAERAASQAAAVLVNQAAALLHQAVASPSQQQQQQQQQLMLGAVMPAAEAGWFGGRHVLSYDDL